MEHMIKRLKELRKEKHISQQELADAIIVTQQSVNRYENHDVEPGIETLIKMAKFFNTSVDYLIGNTDVNFKSGRYDIDMLSENESCIIEKYRKIDDKYKKIVSNLIDEFISLQ